MKKYSTFFISVLCVILLTVSCRRAQTRNKGKHANNRTTIRTNQLVSTEIDPHEVVTVSDKLLIPKKTPSKKEILLHRIAYKLSYNTETRQPNWVAWLLTSEHTNGPFPRKGVPYYDESGKALGISSFSDDIVHSNYFVDMDVPSPRQEHTDWKEHPMGIDHGHMCPAADCKWDKGAMNQSFLLTNMCPQDHELNGGNWDKLENMCRTWAKNYGGVYIVAGPIFNNDKMQHFGKNKIPIPDAFFKVILCTSGNPKALGFIFPNDGTHHALKNYMMSVDEVEDSTGFDFFPVLADSIEAEVESCSNLVDWK